MHALKDEAESSPHERHSIDASISLVPMEIKSNVAQFVMKLFMDLFVVNSEKGSSCEKCI